MRNFTLHRFPIKNLMIDFLLTTIMESTYLQTECYFHNFVEVKNIEIQLHLTGKT